MVIAIGRTIAWETPIHELPFTRAELPPKGASASPNSKVLLLIRVTPERPE